jgi:hypothetical protein
MSRRHAVALSLGLALASSAHGQSIAERMKNVGTKTVAFSARARSGVCGDGKGSYNDGLTNTNTRFFESGTYISYDGAFYSEGVSLMTYEPWDTRITPCEPGPVRVIIRVVDNQPSTLHVAVGPLPALADTILDLGTISAASAGTYLQGLVRGTDGRVSTSAIMPIVLIDSSPRWDVLAAAARDSMRLLRYRRRASDLLARASALSIPLEPNVDEGTRGIRREAVNAFVRQRQKPDDCIPELLDIARRNPHRDSRVAALYQLGQTADPRAIDLFLELLRGRP